ncbi:MAG: selenide, water dikinase SelD, partial [Fidelibacterota bacterium]
YAMGGKPLFALNIAAFPADHFSTDVMARILMGGQDKAKEAGISIVGGHTIDDAEPKYGLVVTGEVSLDRMVRNSTARPGDVLVLTKPLGTGIISMAIKRGVAGRRLIKEATEIMTTLNELASDLMMKRGVHAATDVTGYGLLGHLLEMCQASGVSARIDFNRLPFVEGVEDLAKKNIVPGGTGRNLEFVLPHTRFNDDLIHHRKMMAADAQTSGGLLIAFPEPDADQFLSEFNSLSPIPACRIGQITPKKETFIFVL